MNMICEFFQVFLWEKCLASGTKSWNTRRNCYWIITEIRAKFYEVAGHLWVDLKL